MALKLYNTYTREKEEFRPENDDRVTLYTCGPTVYDYASIGNLRSYIFADTLIRTLKHNGYDVYSVQNVTDVGHLTDDGDEGADKMEERAKKEGRAVKEIAKYYADIYFKDRRKLDLLEPNVWAYATQHIEDQINFIKKLEEKGYTYTTSDGVYFDSRKIDSYGKLANLDIKGLMEGARVAKNPEKKSPTDFALWKFTNPDIKREQEWESPWGVGFPGWHLECSAMSIKYLSDNFDIHTGGVDHIPIHHINEIAQNIGYNGNRGANFWMHNEFITIDGEKMSKSKNNIYTLTDLVEKGFSPMDYKYFLHSAHYRQKENFTWEALKSAQNAYEKITKFLMQIEISGKVVEKYQIAFDEAINDDLSTPRALAVLWELIKDRDIEDGDKKATLLYYDEVLALGLTNIETFNIPDDVVDIIKERNNARESSDWQKSDELRDKLSGMGYEVLDTENGTEIRPK